MKLLVTPSNKTGHGLRATAAAAAASSQAAMLSRQLTDKLVAKMGSLMGGPFPYTFRWGGGLWLGGGGTSRARLHQY
jgi:uncharacterized protein YfaQ (DUF2300 family)